MKIVEDIRKDAEIKEMKATIKELTGKNAPPFSYDQHGSIDKYKKDLKDRIKHLTK